MLGDRMTIMRSTFYSILFFLYLSLSLLRFTWPDQLINSIIIASIGVYALISVPIDRNLRTLILVFTFTLILAFLASSMLNLRVDRVLQNIIFILASSGIALLLTTELVALWTVSVTFWGLSGYFIFLMYRSTDPMQAIFTSQNGISMMILVAAISYYIVSCRVMKKINLIPAFVTLIITIWGVGRSGIIVGFILLFGLVMMKLNNKILRILLFLGIILFALFMLTPLYGSPDQVKFFYGLFKNTILELAIENYSKTFDRNYTGRIEILEYYFQNMDLRSFLFGVNSRTEYWPGGDLLDYNYHNSFVALHSQTGFIGLITIILLILSYIKFLKKEKVYSILILCLCFRWSTDSYLFFEFFDFIPLFFIFMLFKTTTIVVISRRKSEKHAVLTSDVSRG